MASEETSTQDESQRQRVLLINRSYWPDAEATGQLLTELSEDLSKTFEVVVLTGQPNANPTNETFRKSGSEFRNGVEIQRVRHTTFGKASKVGRMVNLITFFLAAACRAVFVKRVDAIVVETDPFLMSLSLPFLRLRHRCRAIVYLQDIYPDVAVQLGVVKNGLLVRFLRHLLFSVYRTADKVVVLSRDMKDLCVRHGVVESRIEIIPNWTDTTLVSPIKSRNPFRLEQQIDDKFVIMHSGNMGMGQDLMSVLRLAEKLKDTEEYLFLFVGDGARKNELQTWAESNALSNVRFLPYQPREKLRESLSAADLHVVAMKPAIQQCLMPSKLYGVLASGTPILAIAPQDSELSEVVRENDLGIATAGNDIDELQAFIKLLSSDKKKREAMGRRARALCEAQFDRKVVTGRFEQVLTHVMTPSAAEAATVSHRVHGSNGKESMIPSEPEASRIS